MESFTLQMCDLPICELKAEQDGELLGLCYVFNFWTKRRAWKLQVYR